MTTRRRSLGRPFPKGASGNPGGRPKIVKEVEAWARQLCEEKGRTQLEDIATDAPDVEVRLRAWTMLFDRAYGKAPQALKVEGGDTPMNLVVDLVPALPKSGS